MVKKYLPIGVLVLVWILIAIVNYSPNTWLSGWDNLHPEFDFLINIKRSLFAVWQEYQGLGLLGGMGHASDLPRQLILWALSLIVPTNLLRYTWTISMLGIGMIGVYVLLVYLVLPKLFKKSSEGKIELGGVVGGIFYATNLATIQMFATPFEAFVTHFGFLPWLIYLASCFINSPTRKHILLFALATLLSTTQGYVPTVFLVYVIILGFVSLTALKKAFVLWAITLTINAFWLGPFVYFTISKSDVTLEAKINQIATGEVYERNRAYGTIADTIQLKGFWFDTFDLDPQKSELTPSLGIIRTLANTLPAQSAGYAVFSIVLLGLTITLYRKTWSLLWLPLLFLFGFITLTTDSPPFSYLNDQIRKGFPLFAQAFRFPFTKFSILLGLSYSLLLAIGLVGIISIGKKGWLAMTLGVLLILFGLWPGLYFSIGGQLFYSALSIERPKEYDDLFAYFSKHGKDKRIANFPQHTFWGWSYYRWGYTGSGFLWYGTPQPIMDRAFDVWSRENENYYWELTYALYSKDTQAFEAVFDKYDIGYILLDENIISASHNRPLFTDEIKNLLSDIPTIRLVESFGKIKLYERMNEETNLFVSVKQSLPTVGPVYKWTDNDVAFKELGDYINGDPASITYPFRSLFTKRAVDEREFSPSDINIEKQVYDSNKTNDLDPSAVTTCGLVRKGKTAVMREGGYLRFETLNQRACLSFGIASLPHTDAYLVTVEYRNITGRPLSFALINQTAKHTEIETLLEGNDDWQKSSFILPPLAFDGLGYTVYLSNDSIGRHESINDIKSIRFYKIPYQELVQSVQGTVQRDENGKNAGEVISVSHPNPAYYRVQVNSTANSTLVLSQSYDPGWITWPTMDHVLINNWANGWRLNGEKEIIIFFLPQLLEFIGFALLPLPFLYALWRKDA